MTGLVRALVLSQDVAVVRVAHAYQNRTRTRMIAPGVRQWLYRLGRQNLASTRAEEGRGTKYPKEGR